ncbi:undecaprenyldiphospho-muramoylpentapeptide beta-N-acetylglucosaminyltransferase [Sphingobacterium sp. LRF_L2]|uniref:undecaprenyldiphospho-muramoylpentapeptide beta-N-acetylglucosaminyltransferase n=1 Tax=Sphingobacterium sp. LRF_L2 TaxID=3369421 RepID=UPI003F6370EA
MAHKIIISGGGTGGHIFPAIAIANALRQLEPDVEILFVGAKGRMEMERVPAAGYSIVGLDIQGINRKSLLKNITLPFKMISSLMRAKRIIREFKADVAVGVGGYASGPLLMMANTLGVPTLIQEQNSYAGVTNKRLGNKAARICVAYEGMEQFFSRDKLLLTGNPIRRASVDIAGKKEEALASFGLKEGKKTVLFTGGSLGAKTLNDCVRGGLSTFEGHDIQVIWQCGSYYYETLDSELKEVLPKNVVMVPFLQRMDYAYAASDLIISRAGAGTISELCAIGKAVILVPSPNVAEDHQTKNAHALAVKQAAVLIKDDVARGELLDTILSLFEDESKRAQLGVEIKKLAKLEADEIIAKEVLKLIR